MRAYVCAAYPDYERAAAFMRALEARGFEITEDWTRYVDEFPPGKPCEDRMRFASADFQGVFDADVVYVLTPDRLDHGAGMWVEFGIALALGRQTVVCGTQRERNVFTALADLVVATDNEALEAVAT